MRQRRRDSSLFPPRLAVTQTDGARFSLSSRSHGPARPDAAAVRSARVGQEAVRRARRAWSAKRGRCKATARRSASTALRAEVALYVGGWLVFCSSQPVARRAWHDRARGGFQPLAFQKAIVWSMLLRGARPRLRQRSAHRALLPADRRRPLLPAAGHDQAARSSRASPCSAAARAAWLDVLLYAALLVACVRALVAASARRRARSCRSRSCSRSSASPTRRIFLAARAEHYWVTFVCFAVRPRLDRRRQGRAARAVVLGRRLQAQSPLPRPSSCVMTSNGPLTRFAWLRRAHVPRLPARPAPLALGDDRWRTAAPRSSSRVPLAFLLTPLGGAARRRHRPHAGAARLHHEQRADGRAASSGTSMVVYGGFALFWAHPDVSVLTLGAAAARGVPRRRCWSALPLLGNLFPRSHLVPARDALLRGQLGVLRVALPRRRRTGSSSG